MKLLLLAVAALGFGSTSAFGQSHAYISMMRSGAGTHAFISQSLEGMYGRFRLADKADASGDKTAGTIKGAPTEKSEFWQGYNIRTTVGIELMKFIQFSVSHGSLSLRSRSSGFENLRGSQLNGESKLVFQSPIGNLEGGAGVIGGRYDFQRQLEDAAFYSSGMYYTLAWNYYISYQVSVFGNAKLSYEHMERNSGSTSVSSIDSATTALGLGFSIWL
jgi:hypothetical protein